MGAFPNLGPTYFHTVTLGPLEGISTSYGPNTQRTYPNVWLYRDAWNAWWGIVQFSG